MDLSMNDIDMDIDSIAMEVMDKSFEAINLADIEMYHTEPATKGKNMERLREWYQRTSAYEWSEYYAHKDRHQTNSDDESEADENVWSSDEYDDEESISSCETSEINTEMALENDEIYCICKRPDNIDAMVACDGDGCKYEWFHFACVGLPLSWSSEESWLCPECRES